MVGSNRALIGVVAAVTFLAFGCAAEQEAGVGAVDAPAAPSAPIDGVPASNGGNPPPPTAGMGSLPGPDQPVVVAPPSMPGLPPVAQPATGVPCGVQAVVKNNCGNCHGATPVGGAVRLTTHEDWHQMSPLFDPSKRVFEVAQTRLDDGTMPQGSIMAPGDMSVLRDWLASGATAAPATQGACDLTPVTPQPQPTGPGQIVNQCEKPGANEPPRATAGPDETCYDFPVTAAVGDGKFTIQPGESYHEWYYAVPWGPGDVWTRFGADFDREEVLHHYLVFTSSAARAPGDVATNVTGTTLGTSATLIGGWAVGGCGTINPPDIGGQLLPSPLVMIQWHMYNTTGAPAQDGSVVQICTAPAASRPNTSGITFLGTENFNGFLGMPPGESSFTTRCTNNSGAPVTLIGFNPHMHLLGKNMKTEVQHLDGTMETVFDMPFQFDYQVNYEIPRYEVMPGETLVTTCSFNNNTGANVAFGESTNKEMCYQFALSYPAGALNNSAPSLIGALNTCW